jgi:hypothetical protein
MSTCPLVYLISRFFRFKSISATNNRFSLGTIGQAKAQKASSVRSAVEITSGSDVSGVVDELLIHALGCNGPLSTVERDITVGKSFG